MRKLSILILFSILLFTASSCSAETNEREQKKTQETFEIISEDVIIGEGSEWELNGILTLPKDRENISAVVLVQGSGPSDMDETVYENKPFLEIAEYLSTNGIAVIRYDKRTFTHGAKMVQELGGSLTVAEETIEDAVLATDILKADPRINADKVFILGHSLGGSLAPRIHAAGGNYAGLIFFAGSPRSLLEIIADQKMLYVKETMEGVELEEALKSFELVGEQFAAIENMPDDKAKASTETNGASLFYYKDNLINKASDYLKDIKVPILVMQGKNDLQVFYDKDFQSYKELLGDRSNVTFKLYEGLNHFFMPSSEKKISKIQEEYKIKAEIDKNVLSDIVNWIKDN